MEPKYSTAATIMYGLLKVIFLRLKSSLCLLEGPYDPTRATPMKTSLKNRLCVPWNFFALIRSHTAVLESRKVGLELKRGNRFWVLREILKFIALLFPFSSQLKICSFCVVVEQRRLWNLHVQSCCFAQINLLSFRRSRCRRRSTFVRSQCTANTQSRTKNSLNLELKQ